MGEELLYYHLYNEEVACYLYALPQLFNRPFIIFKSLILQLNIMIQHTLFCPFIQHYVNIQEVFEINRIDYEKIHQ